MLVHRCVPSLILGFFAVAAGPALAQTAYHFGDGRPVAPSGLYLPAPAPSQTPFLGYWAPMNGRTPSSPVYNAPEAGHGPGPALYQRREPVRPRRRSIVHANALARDHAASFTPDTAALTRRAARRYARIVDAGGWPVVPVSLRPGLYGPAVAILRQRLAIEGDLVPANQENNDRWTPAVTAAVRRYQARVGLPQTGIVAGATLKALNVPARVRLRQLQATVSRLSSINFSFGPRYVAVNIPAQSVEAVQNGEAVRRYIAVVGSPEHRSPEIAAHIQSINLNPNWTVPASIIKNEIIPEMRKDPGYLNRERIRVLNNLGTEINPSAVNWKSDEALHYVLRQDSGAHDALGRLLIDMPNNEAVYMHDTPSKWLFNLAYRFKSHGCVRIKDVYDLAAWLLQGTPAGPYGRWSTRALEAGIVTGRQRVIRLVRSVPVIWVYMTGWADADGVVHFRNDVYHEDSGAQDMVHAQLQ